MLLRIQGLRAVAILAVLLFHLWPSLFPNGYVGVDVFFVISGYLMAMIFSKSASITVWTITDFYYKRIKRIFPLYYLVVPCTLLAGHFLLGKAWIPSTNEMSLYALALLKNMKTIWDGENYFLAFQASSNHKDLFLHLWSLAVEIQFYILVPFIFLLMAHFKSCYLKIAFLAFISALACFQYYYSNPIFSFNYFLSRLWQFGAGMIGFYANLPQEPCLDEKKASNVKDKTLAKVVDATVFAAYLPVLLTLAPQTINPDIMRPLATFSCFLLIVLENEMSKRILTGGLIVYIGDLSYTLYLVHWPVITLFGDEHTIQFVLGIIIIISLFIHHCYEGLYRSFSVKKTIALLTLLALFNGVVFTSLLKCPYIKEKMENYRAGTVPLDLKQVIEKNSQFAVISVAVIVKGAYNQSASSAFPTLTPPWGVYDYPKGHGTNRIMVIGNSYGLNEANVIHESLEGNYSEFRLLAALGFQVLYDEWVQSPDKLHGQHDKNFEIVKEFQPDYLFIVTRYQIHQKRQLRGEDMSKDILVQQYDKNIARLEQITKKGVYIHGPTPTYALLLLNQLIDGLTHGTNIEKFHLSKKEADEEMYSSLKRVESISCQKCHVYNILPAFEDEEHTRYLAYDPKTLLAFFDNDIHMTLAGQERLRPVYRQIVEKLE